MQNVCFITPQILVQVSTAACYRLKGKGRDELLPRASQNYIHERACLRKLGCKVSGFIDGNGTRHTEQNVFIGKYGHTGDYTSKSIV
jgi:hypothetical protein